MTRRDTLRLLTGALAVAALAGAGLLAWKARSPTAPDGDSPPAVM